MSYITNIKKIANSIEMSFEVPDAEKALAKEAKIRFEAAFKRLRDSINHLDIIYEPFKRHDSVSTKSLISRRGLLNRYEQKVKNNFNEFKTISLLAIRKLNNFTSGDTTIQEIINSFDDSVRDTEKLVNKFLDLIGDYESETFREDIINSIDSIRVQGKSLESLIKERIIDHIDDNILSNNWMNSKRDELGLDMTEKSPLIVELFKERQKALDPNSYPEQELNPSGANKIHYPGYARTMNIGESE